MIGQTVAVFLSLGIIDHFISDTYREFEEKKFVNDVQNIIEVFPKVFLQAV